MQKSDGAMAFTIDGPLKLKKKEIRDPESRKAMQLVDGKASKGLLPTTSTSTDIGVYIFAIGKQGGAGAILPWYVGKTEKSNLGKESLHADKLRKYATAIEREGGGTPMLYFLLPENGWDKKQIDKLETFLIWLARQRNPGLLNERKNLSPNQLESMLRTVRVYGLQENRTGPASAATNSFRRMIGWNEPVHVVEYG
jgi:hypothetical protein